jgi:hypothetical protein
VDADGASGLPPQSGLALVCFDLSGMRVRVVGARMTYLLGALQVPLSSPTSATTASMIAGSSDKNTTTYPRI